MSTAVQVKQEAEKHAKQNRRRVIIGSTIGTTIGFYDFYVYATAAVALFPHLFFAETDNPTVALLRSFATFGLAFIVRPLGSVVFGHFGDRFGRKPTLFWSTVVVIVFGLTFEMFLAPDKATLFSSLVFLTIGMFVMGLIFGPMSAVLPELFPTYVRYTGSGLSYNAASILGAAIASFIATWLNASFGVASVGYYLVAVSIGSLLAIALMRESRELDMTEI